VPVVFSPGEVEVRPLRPEETAYTTAQRIADLLEIGKPDAVAVSADSEADRVYVTGADYRGTGFSVNDTILIYSDAQALGIEKTITAVTEGGANGVALYFTGSFGHGDYEAADNTYVQNQASFTDRTGSGPTKAKVDRLILRAQDVIDNKTHNAWRPYLVISEYLNFDTYKPYRRRYYTDYVGTAPLLFRNVQQMLRLELWQGDDYREVGAAEARITIGDHSALGSDGVYLSPGGGGIFSLTVGTSTSTWNNAFDKMTAAQQLADLINKDSRKGKTVIAASPSFTMEDASQTDGTRTVYVNDEFLASANSDYGRGIVKITSMRDGSAGETCTIATDDLTNIEISQTTTQTTTSTSVSSTTVNVASTTGFASYGLIMVGSGTSVEVLSYTGTTATSFTGCANVVGTPLTTLNSSGTTAFQYLMSIDFQGGSAVGDKARLRDWWIDTQMGIIYFNNSYPFFEWNAIKASYVYGERYVEKAIEDVCTKMVAIELLMSDDRSVLIPEGTQNVDLTSKIQLWQRDIDNTLPRYREVVVFE
jgi:hypothetical protein